MELRHIPGVAVAVAHHGTVVYANGYGFADIQSEQQATADTVFLIASITKTFTAVATMMLVEDGHLSLDTALGELLYDLPEEWILVTVRQLLEHTSGIHSVTSDIQIPCGESDKGPVVNPRDMLEDIACLPLEFAPGTDWAYSDTGYLLLGLIIESVSRVSYESFLRDRIFVPLNMNSTRLLNRSGVPSELATGYVWEHDRFKVGPLLTGVEEYAFGGLTSTVKDLSLWSSALSSGMLLEPETLAAMLTPATVGDAVYGLGFSLRPIAGRQQFGHTGGGVSAATILTHFTEEDISIIVLTNAGQPPFSMRSFSGDLAAIILEE